MHLPNSRRMYVGLIVSLRGVGFLPSFLGRPLILARPHFPHAGLSRCIFDQGCQMTVFSGARSLCSGVLDVCVREIPGTSRLKFIYKVFCNFFKIWDGELTLTTVPVFGDPSNDFNIYIVGKFVSWPFHLATLPGMLAIQCFHDGANHLVLWKFTNSQMNFLSCTGS